MEKVSCLRRFTLLLNLRVTPGIIDIQVAINGILKSNWFRSEKNWQIIPKKGARLATDYLKRSPNGLKVCAISALAHSKSRGIHSLARSRTISGFRAIFVCTFPKALMGWYYAAFSVWTWECSWAIQFAARSYIKDSEAILGRLRCRAGFIDRSLGSSSESQRIRGDCAFSFSQSM